MARGLTRPATSCRLQRSPRRAWAGATGGLSTAPQPPPRPTLSAPDAGRPRMPARLCVGPTRAVAGSTGRRRHWSASARRAYITSPSLRHRDAARGSRNGRWMVQKQTTRRFVYADLFANRQREGESPGPPRSAPSSRPLIDPLVFVNWNLIRSAYNNGRFVAGADAPQRESPALHHHEAKRELFKTRPAPAGCAAARRCSPCPPGCGGSSMGATRFKDSPIYLSNARPAPEAESR